MPHRSRQVNRASEPASLDLSLQVRQFGSRANEQETEAALRAAENLERFQQCRDAVPPFHAAGEADDEPVVPTELPAKPGWLESRAKQIRVGGIGDDRYSISIGTLADDVPPQPFRHDDQLIRARKQQAFGRTRNGRKAQAPHLLLLEDERRIDLEHEWHIQVSRQLQSRRAQEGIPLVDDVGTKRFQLRACL